jgi:hypothetical protein
MDEIYADLNGSQPFIDININGSDSESTSEKRQTVIDFRSDNNNNYVSRRLSYKYKGVLSNQFASFHDNDEEDVDDRFEEDNDIFENTINATGANDFKLKSDNIMPYEEFRPKKNGIFNSTLISSTSNLNFCSNIDETSNNCEAKNCSSVLNETYLIELEASSKRSDLNEAKLEFCKEKSTLNMIKNMANCHPLGIRSDSLVEGLLGDIYDRFNITFKENIDSDVLTEISSLRFSGGDSTADNGAETRNYSKYHKLAKSSLNSYGRVQLYFLNLFLKRFTKDVEFL